LPSTSDDSSQHLLSGLEQHHQVEHWPHLMHAVDSRLLGGEAGNYPASAAHQEYADGHTNSPVDGHDQEIHLLGFLGMAFTHCVAH